MICYYIQYRSDIAMPWTFSQVNSSVFALRATTDKKDGVYFAMLFTLRESLRRLGSESLRLLQRWGKDTIFHGCQVKKNPHFAPIVILPSYIGSG